MQSKLREELTRTNRGESCSKRKLIFTMNTNITPRSKPSEEEYEVYSVALRKVHHVREGELIVLEEKTTSSRLINMKNKALIRDLRKVGLKDPKQLIGSGLPEISKETVEDFI